MCYFVMPSHGVSDLQLSRRDAIKSGFAGLGLSAAPTSPLLQFGAVIPSVSRVWMEIGTTGDAEFIAEFDSNVRRAFYIPGLNESKLESVAKSQGLDLSIEDVSVSTPGSTKSENTLSGTVSDFVAIDSTDDRTTASTDLITVDPAALDNLLPIVNIASKAKPERRDFLTVRMPDGFTYSLPQDADRVGPRMEVFSELLSNGFLENISEPPVTESQIRYDGNDRKLTFPTITHWVNDDLSWVRSSAMLKYSVLDAPEAPYQLMDLYDVTWYGEQAVEDAFEIGAAIGNELGKMAIEEVLFSNVPSPINAGLDAKSILSALNPEFMTEYENENEGGIFSGIFSNSDSSGPPESWGKSSQASMQTLWLNEAIVPDRDTVELEDHGFGSLYLLAQIERGFSQLLVTTPNEAVNNDLIEIYLSLLETQQEIAQTTRGNLVRRQANVHDAEYWQNLHKYALTVCEKIAILSENQATVLNEI